MIKPSHPASCNDQSPFISVVMPVYNAAEYLADAIESILSQTHVHFEFIIVDDCSNDRSAEIIRLYALKDQRIRPLYLPHQGAGAAANAAIAAAKGEIVARMDADDIALPERLSTQIAWMHRTGVDICGSCIKAFGAENRIMWFPESHEAIRMEMVFRCAVMQPAMMLRTEVARQHLYNESLYFEDYELLTRLALKYRMGNVPQVLLKYRVHSRQRHICKAAAVRMELRKYSTEYFLSLFPEVQVGNIEVLRSLVLNKPLRRFSELERAGKLLTTLARVEDRFFRYKMAQRWWSVCRRSAGLGFKVLIIYLNHITSFGVKIKFKDHTWLAIACSFRLGYEFRGKTFLKSLAGRVGL